MLKIFTTQLLGVFNDIQKNNENDIEDSARLLAQAVISDGKIIVHGLGSYQSVAVEAVEGENKLPKAEYLKNQDIEPMDAVLIAANENNQEEALSLARELKNKGCPVIGIFENAGENGYEYVDIVIQTGKNRPIVPLNDDKKIGKPSSMASLYAYLAVYLTTIDMLDEQELY
ncbi:putative phosphosugar-binding protein [Scopulibacillus daqui]|uniref:Phosphosugar-binding protein n=1 Tax=Scopulibacillus daqui TaxID=1469162 RepID=A0ABS2PZA9_9BACL|nr:DUF2529 family protein [Scopulibacillus daqui]MBM7645388.1 putative phosphosugar-binding protein [Scopulibacillus daqui]